MNSFLERFGFRADPFEFTNADEEPLLAVYFVPPPYFPTVLGDPATPHAHIVFAPRGTGKTAQRRMVEANSVATGRFLCITYDAFDQPSGFSAADATWAYHINQICRLLVMGILLTLENGDAEALAARLTDHQKQVLKAGVGRFLGSLSAEEYERSVQAIKSLGDKAGDLWRKYGGPIAAGVQVLMKKAGFDDVHVPSELAEEAKRDDSLNYFFQSFLEIAAAIGYEATYILVDKVDESALTGNAEKSWQLIRPLIVDLPTLETPRSAFKFFVWDELREPYLNEGGRPDRVKLLTLDWSVDELTTMLARRLEAYSDGQVRSLNDLLCDEFPYDLHALVAFLSAGSPRDMIRVAKSVIDERTRTSSDHACLDADSIWAGIREFSEQRASELFGAYLQDVRKVNRPTFVVNDLANDVFHTTTQAARARVQNWTKTGIVRQVGEKPNPGNRPMHLYGIVDPRVALVAMSGSEVPLILGNYAIECPQCNTIQISAEATISCTVCGREFRLDEARSLLEVCRR